MVRSCLLTTNHFDGVVRFYIDIPEQPAAGASSHLLEGAAVLRDLLDVLLRWLAGLVVDDEVGAGLAEPAVDTALEEAAVFGDGDGELASERLGGGNALEGRRFRHDGEALLHLSGGGPVDTFLGGEEVPERGDRRPPVPPLEHAVQQGARGTRCEACAAPRQFGSLSLRCGDREGDA